MKEATPRTDALKAKWSASEGARNSTCSPEAHEIYDLAEKLERENAALKSQVAELQDGARIINEELLRSEEYCRFTNDRVAELERQAFERADTLAEVMSRSGDWESRSLVIADLKKQVAELRPNAERYQIVRTHHIFALGGCGSPEEVDRVVDEARISQKHLMRRIDAAKG